LYSLTPKNNLREERKEKFINAQIFRKQDEAKFTKVEEERSNALEMAT